MRARSPIWLHAITVRLGAHEYDAPGDDSHRWMWRDGDCGLRITRRSRGWIVFAWSPARSANLLTEREPSAADLASTAALAGLCGPTAPAPAGAVRFTPAGVPVPQGPPERVAS